ncbi:MAG: lipoprotein [Gammaproteobacteria bacterium]|nr:hypothetical protein [Gammaproteobacteria bacterium]
MRRRVASSIRSQSGRGRVERHAGPLALTFLCAAAFAALPGCGQKGPLVLPDRGAVPTTSESGEAPAQNGDEREGERRAGDNAR